MKRLVMVLTGTLALSFGDPATATVTEIVRYDAGVSGNTTPVLDQSGAGNNGAIGGLDGVALSADVPDSAPVGAMSYDFSPFETGLDFDSRIVTQNVNLIANPLVAAAGGFTMETWFKADLPFAMPLDLVRYNPNLISYAGTERIAIVNTDNTTPGAVTVDGTLQFTTSDGGFAVAHDINDVNVIDGNWHHVLAEFVVTDATDLTNLIGVLRMTVDETFVYTAPGNKTNLGDSINRPISFGFHPTGVNPRDDFEGLLYNPSVSLGALAGLLGDYNNDGVVDAADYVVWRDNDINGQQGYDDWRANFGAMSPEGGGGANAVPEPASWLLGLLVIGMCSAAYRAWVSI